MKKRIINIYKKLNNLEVKSNLLKLLNKKYICLGLTDADFETENILNNLAFCDELNNKNDRKLIMRYGRNYNSIIFELINKVFLSF